MEVSELAEPAKLSFVQLLRGHIVCESVSVPVLTQYYPEDKSPAITMWQTGISSKTSGKTWRWYRRVASPLPSTHPYYDPANPNSAYVQQQNKQNEDEKEISLHFWSNSIDELDCMVDQFKQRLTEAQHYHYTCCTKYDPTTHFCSFDGEECPARTTYNRFSVQGKCPYPDERKPIHFFEAAGISTQSVFIRNEVFLGELAETPEIYKATINLSYNIVSEYTVRVNPLCAISTNRTDDVLDS
jgi:hypothetical protein